MTKKITVLFVLFFTIQYVAMSQYVWSNVSLFGGANSAGTTIRFADDGPTTTYVAGSFDGTYNFGAFPLTCTGNNAGFAAKIDNGTISWAQAFGGSSSSCDVVDVVQQNGFMYIIGNYTYFMTVGPVTINSAGGYDIFLLVLDGAGNFAALSTYGGPQDDNVAGMVANTNGDLYMTGYFSGTSMFGTVSLTSAGASDAFISKLDAAGTVQWAHKGGGTNGDAATGIALINDLPYINGTFKGSNVMFGTNSVSLTNNDYGVFLAKYDDAGNNIYVQKAAQSPSPSVKNLAAGGNKLFMCGVYTTSINIGGQALPGNSGADIFVACFDSTGLKQWAKKGGSTGFADEVSYIAAEADGYCTIVGSNNSSIAFGSVSVPQTSYTEVYAFGFDLVGNAIYGLGAAGLGFQRGGFVKSVGVNKFIYAGMVEGSTTFSGNVLTSPAAASFFIGEVSLGTLSNQELSTQGQLFIHNLDNNGNILITILNQQAENDVVVSITDITGKLLLNKALQNGQVQLNTNDLATGTYIIRAAGEKINVAQKFLVQ